MKLTTHTQAGTAVAASRARVRAAEYRSASWSAFGIFGCTAADPMAHNGHKTTRPRPLEPSQ